MAKVIIDRERCKGCQLCLEFCPKGCIELEDALNRKGYRPTRANESDECKGCAICALVCPDVAIEVWR